MKKRRLTAIFLISAMILQMLTAVVYADGKYGNEILSDTGFEDKSAGEKPTTWRAYTNYNTSYAEIISKDDYPDWVHEGDQALRFISAGSNTDYGVRYNDSKLVQSAPVGTVFEFSAYAKTNIVNDDAVLNVVNSHSDGYQFEGTSSFTLTNEWQKISALYIITEENKGKGFYLTLTTPQTTTIKESDFSGSSSAKYDSLKEAHKEQTEQSYIIIDDVSFHTVVTVSADNGKVNYRNDGASDDVFYASYDYDGIETEGNSTLTWCVSNTQSGTVYEEIKTVNNVNAENAEEKSALILDKSYVNKYIFFKLTPTNKNGENGAEIKSETLKIEDGASYVSNGDFIKDIYGWSGNAEFVNEDSEGEDTSGAMRVNGSASYNVVYNGSEPSDFVFSFKAKGESLSYNVGADDESVELTQDYETYSFTINVASSFELVLNGNAVIDKISVAEIKPEVKSAVIEGEPVVGNEISASYEYHSAVGTKEGDSEIKWYVSESSGGDGTEVSNEKTLTVSEDWNKKYISFTVTPVDVNGVAGKMLKSNSVQVRNIRAYNLKLEATGNKTNDILYPSYEYSGDSSEGKTVIEWIQADSPNAPDDLWEVIDSPGKQYRKLPQSNVTASTAKTTGILFLGQAQRGKYVRFRITPVDGSGKKGVPVMSECVGPIEFERNLINNGDMSYGSLGYVGGVKFSESSLNSDIDGVDDGTKSLIVDATSQRRGYDVSGGVYVENRGNDTVSYYFATVMDSKLSYDFSADFRLDYPHETTMNISFMQQEEGTSGGYQYATADIFSNKWTRVTNSVSGKSSENWGRITVRCQGSLTDPEIVNSGKFIIDNLSLYAKQPYVTDLSISGNSQVGNTINASYKFNGAYEVGTEYESKINWLVSDYPWGPWEPYREILGTDEEDYSLNITSDLQNKYIRFSVTPCDIIGTTGLEMQTTKEIYVAPTDRIETSISGEMSNGNTVTGDVSFENVQNISRNITAVLAGYKNVNGVARMTNIAYNTVKVPAYGSTDFSVSLNATEEDNGAEAVLYVLDGGDISKLKPLRSASSAGIVACDKTDNRAFADNDNKKAMYMSSTDESNMKFSVVAIKDGAVITKDNVADNVIYFGIGTSNKNKLFGAEFDINKAQNGDTYRVYKTNDNGVADSSVTFTYYGVDTANKISEFIKNSTASDLLPYFAPDNRELYDGIDIVTTLNIDMSDYKNVDDKIFVLSTIAQKDYSGKTTNIRNDFEAKSKAKYDEEQLIKRIEEFKDAVNTSNSEEIGKILKKYNDILGLDLNNECGYSYKFNSDGRKSMDKKVYDTVKAAFTNDVLEVPNAVANNFEKTVLLQTINTCGWEDMEKVLLGNKSKLKVDVESMYKKLSTDTKKTEFNKAIYTADFATVSEFESYFVSKGNEIANKTQNTQSGSSNGGGGGGGGTPSNPGAALNPTGTSTNTNKNDKVTFTDITNGHWAYDAIKTCVEKNIINGYDDNTVRPDNLVTRAEFITIIMKALNIEASIKENSFNDVDETAWYNDVISTASAMEIINGLSDDTFAPNEPIKREDMAVMVSRAVKAKGFTLPNERKSNTFGDNNDIASYAKDAINELWCAGIVNGMDDNNFMPKDNVSRAMAVQIAYNLLKIM